MQVLHNNVLVHRVAMQKCAIKDKSQSVTDRFLNSEKHSDFKLIMNSTVVVGHKISYICYIL